MTDFTVPGNIRPDIIEQVKNVSARGKPEAAFLVITGTAASPPQTYFAVRDDDIIIENIKQIGAWKGSPFTIIVSSYPNDIVAGFDDFKDYFPEPPFDSPQRLGANTMAVLTSYAVYVAAPDVIIWAKRKQDTFQNDEFSQPWKINFQSLIIIPQAPPGDLTTLRFSPYTARGYNDWIPDNFIQAQNVARMVIMLPSQAPVLPINNYAGGGKTLGDFYKNRLLGRFH